MSCSNFKIFRIFRKASSNSRDLLNKTIFKNPKKNPLCWVPSEKAPRPVSKEISHIYIQISRIWILDKSIKCWNKIPCLATPRLYHISRTWSITWGSSATNLNRCQIKSLILCIPHLILARVIHGWGSITALSNSIDFKSKVFTPPWRWRRFKICLCT